MIQPAVVAPHEGPPPEVTLVHWTRMATPLGAIYVAATPEGVVRVGTHDATDGAFLAALEAELGARVQPVQGRQPVLDQAVAEISAYFAGRGRTFTVPLDWRLLRGDFNRRALAALQGVGWGHLVSYSELGRWIGAPRAARAIGHACGANPLPILVPCHRVVHADGGIGGYTGPGIAYKRALLAIEGIMFPTAR